MTQWKKGPLTLPWGHSTGARLPPSLLMASLSGLLLSHPATLSVLQILPLAISSLSFPFSLPTLLCLTFSTASSILSGHHK